MNTPIRTLCTFALITWLVGISSASAVPRIDEINRIVAVVDDNVITLEELDRRIETIKLKMGQADRERLPPDSVLRPQVLERLIIERIQLDRARRTGIRVEDEEVNRTIARIAADSGLTLAQFREVLARDGIDFARFREDIRTEMIIARLRNREVDNRVKVTDTEVERFLEARAGRGADREQYHLMQILIAVPEAASPQEVQKARAEAEALYRQLQEGADFRQMAIAHSDGQQALEGGDLGWRSSDQLPTLFAEAIRGMQPGDIAGPIRSPSGFHLVRLAGKRGQERHVVEQKHARHILIRTDELTSDADARNRLERLRDRILAGEDFARLARTHSDDRGSAREGGDLGWANPGTFVPAFERALNELKPGQISEPFKSEFGWHIVQLLDVREHDNTEAYQRSRAHQVLRQRKIEEETENWLRRLRDESYVDIRLEG